MEKSQLPNIAVIGGGASGLVAAISAAKQHTANVYIFERFERVGKKLLATGNGRCNLENRIITPNNYQTNSKNQLSKLLDCFSVDDNLSFFKDCGLLYREEDEGRIYPSCNQASAVLDILRTEAFYYGVKEVCQWEVVEIIPQKQNKFLLKEKNGQSMFADKIILACGGQASPKLGGSEKGYELAKSLEHTITAIYPCLTGLCCKGENLSSLKGVRAECGIRLWNGKSLLKEYYGEVQFNDYGVSGYPIMQVSAYLHQAKKNPTLQLDLIPQLSLKELETTLHQRRKKYKHQTLEQLLIGLLHKKLANYQLKSLFKNTSQTISEIHPQDITTLAYYLKNWTIPISGTPGWDNAQVCGGGVSLEEINPNTFESTICNGVYITGELLDVVGDCGGFNLHWAFGSGIVAGKNAALTI